MSSVLSHCIPIADLFRILTKHGSWQEIKIKFSCWFKLVIYNLFLHCISWIQFEYSIAAKFCVYPHNHDSIIHCKFSGCD